MVRKVMHTLGLAAVTLAMASTLTLAAGPMSGMVTSINKKGVVTWKDDAGKEHHTKVKGFQVGDRIECTAKGKSMSCMKPKA